MHIISLQAMNSYSVQTWLGLSFSSTPGTISIRILSFRTCGALNYCYNTFSKNNPFTLYTQISHHIFSTISRGYNKILLNDRVSVPKGSVVFIDQVGYTSRITINTDGGFHADFMIVADRFVDINTNNNYRLDFNCLIDTNFYFTSLDIQHQYQTTGFYNMTLWFTGSHASKTSKQILVHSCKFYF